MSTKRDPIDPAEQGAAPAAADPAPAAAQAEARAAQALPKIQGDGEAAAASSPIDEPPPFLGSWRNVYLFLLVELGVLVIAFYALTRWAS